MKLNQLTPAILLIALSLTTSLNAQVTIGSGQPPATGALLDLKQEGTTTKGMVLPRVKLVDVDALTMGTNVILDTDHGGDQYKKHTGLWVYNISDITPAKCAPIPDGLYVWDGAKWNGINVTKADPATLDVGSKLNFDLPSGRDLRPLTAQSFTATWSPANPLAYTNTAHTTLGGLSFTTTPLTASPLAPSPASFSMTPDAMTPAEITANPFRTKESILSFSITDECGRPVNKTITLNQTNKALTLATTSYDYPTAGAKSNTLQSNSNWQLASIMPADATNAISNVRVGSPATSLPTNTTQTGYEHNNNAGNAATLTYDIAVNSTRSRYSTLTFADASATKRFSDVTITVLQCTNVGISPTIEQWALIAGFTQTQVNAVKTTGTDSPILATGIQLHRDQSNNLFLSSSFHATDITGTTNTDRWMIHNLSAKNYSTNVTHGATPARTLSGPNGNAGAPYNTAYWAYPKAASTITVGEAASTEFTNNPRLGLLYTWDAATAGKGGTTGQTSFTDGEPVTHTAVQGICPDGWHLPSDVEWTTLEQELATNTSRYSSTPNVGGTIAIGVTGYRGTTHGKAMKELCEPFTAPHQGTSNGITSTARPGFDLLLAGYAYNGSAYDFGADGYLWSASGNGTGLVWCRYVGSGGSGGSQVGRGNTIRINLLSVRCKK